jgi:hypothetical protein
MVVKSHAQTILQSARIAELKVAVALVKPRPRIELPDAGRCDCWL